MEPGLVFFCIFASLITFLAGEIELSAFLGGMATAFGISYLAKKL